jgi:hypothetical protein
LAAVVQATIISDETRSVDARAEGDRLLVDADALPAAIDWELKPQGLCHDEVCVPLRDRHGLFVDGQLDLAAIAAALGRPVVVDAAAGIAAMALDPTGRRQALTALEAPSFTLDDLDGNPHSLDEWRGRKKLLFAFASW